MYSRHLSVTPSLTDTYLNSLSESHSWHLSLERMHIDAPARLVRSRLHQYWSLKPFLHLKKKINYSQRPPCRCLQQRKVFQLSRAVRLSCSDVINVSQVLFMFGLAASLNLLWKVKDPVIVLMTEVYDEWLFFNCCIFSLFALRVLDSSRWNCSQQRSKSLFYFQLKLTEFFLLKPP